MGYQSDDRDSGGNRWRDRDEGRGGWNRDRDRERGSYGRSDHDRGGWNRGDDDRGFFDRAGDQVRSWFGDDEAQRRREIDERRWQREQRMTGSRDNDWRGGRDDDWRGGRGDDRPGGRLYGGYGGGPAGNVGGFGAGWGNQIGESWNRDRPGVRSDDDRDYGRGEREGWFTDSVGGERGRRQGGRGDGGGSGYGSGGWSGPTGEQGRGGAHDPNYSQWRQRQIEDLDRDYDEWRREHQSRFEQEFATWRTKRQSQRQLLDRVSKDMAVVGSDGQPVGAVDKVGTDHRIVLKKTDPEARGAHHSIPCGWLETVEDRVTLNRTAAEAMREWRNEDRSRALFEREDSGSEGPHALNRSFAGTYTEDRRDDDR